MLKFFEKSLNFNYKTIISIISIKIKLLTFPEQHHKRRTLQYSQ